VSKKAKQQEIDNICGSTMYGSYGPIATCTRKHGHSESSDHTGQDSRDGTQQRWS